MQPEDIAVVIIGLERIQSYNLKTILLVPIDGPLGVNTGITQDITAVLAKRHILLAVE